VHIKPESCHVGESSPHIGRGGFLPTRMVRVESRHSSGRDQAVLPF
jgi:hypothetical protein